MSVVKAMVYVWLTGTPHVRRFLKKTALPSVFQWAKSKPKMNLINATALAFEHFCFIIHHINLILKQQSILKQNLPFWFILPHSVSSCSMCHLCDKLLLVTDSDTTVRGQVFLCYFTDMLASDSNTNSWTIFYNMYLNFGVLYMSL